jgi:hypothetical protein
MNKKKLSEIIETLKASLPIETVMEDFGIKLYRCGKNYNAFSPFRTGNRSRTSFTISPKLNIFKDWVTGQAGDAIKFVSLLENVSYPEAALILARKYGYITEEEFQGRKKFTKKLSEDLERKHNKIEKEEHKIAPEVILDKVFRLFLSHAKLSDEHKKHLLFERKLSEEDIEKHMFFSFPSRAIMRKLLKDIENAFGGYDNPLDVLKDVPGFYKRKGGSFTFAKYKGIGIPIKNAFDQIIGIQIRSDEVKEGYSRYLWFSSSFAIDDPDGKVEFGTSSGSPIDVVIPSVIKYSVLFITEGKFKAIKIANTYNCIAISVQGIGNWRNIFSVIKEIESSEKIKEKYYGKDFVVKNVFMAFDSDICYNVAVFNQLKKMTDTLLEEKPGLNIYYTYWDINYGKGIDDLINNGGHKDKIKKYEKSVWDSRYEKVIEKAKEGENIDEIWKISKAKFAEYFEKYMEL